MFIIYNRCIFVYLLRSKFKSISQHQAFNPLKLPPPEAWAHSPLFKNHLHFPVLFSPKPKGTLSIERPSPSPPPSQPFSLCLCLFWKFHVGGIISQGPLFADFLVRGMI